MNLNELKKDELVAMVEELECALMSIEDKLCQHKVKPEGRKEQVLKLLQQGAITVDAMAKRIGISNRNISSQLSYLRSDGYPIATDSLGRKFLEK